MIGKKKSSISIIRREDVPSTAGLAALVDVETTGLSSRTDRIVEFAGVLFAYHRQSGEVLGRVYEYASLNDPGISIPSAAMAVHGITQEMVKRQRMNIATIDALLEDADFIVAHNASFDRGFLTPISEVARSKPWACSMRQVNWKANGHRSSALQNLLLNHGINPSRAHRALDDVNCALQLLASKDRDGYPYLRQLIQENPPRQSSEKAQRTGISSHKTTGGSARKASHLNIEWIIKR